ncbi:MAG: hypothetical protein ISS92_06105 [Candidatus Omnitrophica bacterium]|nr:hypothetical protein [Candidatus Omnitrophota bacterium]
MTEELKAFLDKIQEEGVKVAEDKARSIEEEARAKADNIVKKAQKFAANFIEAAKNKSVAMEESGKDALRQAARNTLLSLKEEIKSTLKTFVIERSREALTPSELKKILTDMIKSYSRAKGEGIEVLLSKKDLEALKKSLIADLSSELKKGVTLKSTDDIEGGFRISYDSGKSWFDFTDKALAEYMGKFVNAQVLGILKDAQKIKE